MRPKPTSDQAPSASDAARLFAAADAGQRANRLRTLFAETLDFEPAHGTIPLPVHDNLPANAHHIAGYDGVAVACIALPDPGRTRINKSAAMAARAVADRLGAAPLLAFSNGPNNRLEFVRPLPAGGDRTELRASSSAGSAPAHRPGATGRHLQQDAGNRQRARSPGSDLCRR